MAVVRKARPAGTTDTGIGYLCIMVDAGSGLSFAGLIADGRRAKGWTQDDLERESGVSRATLSRWERGLADRPEAQHVRAVCLALDIDPRRAAVALGYLTAAEINPATGRQLEPPVEEVLQILQDTSVPDDEKTRWIDYLKFLQQRYRRERRSSAS